MSNSQTQSAHCIIEKLLFCSGGRIPGKLPSKEELPNWLTVSCSLFQSLFLEKSRQELEAASGTHS